MTDQNASAGLKQQLERTKRRPNVQALPPHSTLSELSDWRLEVTGGLPSLCLDTLSPLDGNDKRQTDLAQAVINALKSNICVIDSNGRIIAVNSAWNTYANANSGDDATGASGQNYLDVCNSSSGDHSDEAAQFEAGVRAVLDGTLEIYECEYPCHSPWEDRWFLGRVTPLRLPGGGAVIEHVNITAHKQIAEKLRREALTDALTLLPNRRYFMEAAEREVVRVRRFHVPATVVMFDIDHFKAINDTYGHAGGDVALQQISLACVEMLRDIDMIARVGGEEFAVILPSTDHNGGRGAAERMREKIAGLRVHHGGRCICMTASFGLSQIGPDDASIHEALARADAALYIAKKTGRNRVQCANFDEMPKPA